MFDSAAVIRDVQQKQYPKDWQVWQGRSRWGLAIALSLLLLIIGLLAVVLPAFTFSMVSQNSPLADLIFWAIMLLVSALVVWVMLLPIFHALAEGRSSLVLLPEGVVECYHGKTAKITALSFETMQQVEVESGRINANAPVYYWLLITGVDGEQMKWPVHSCYGDPVAMAEKIVGAFQRYQRQTVKQSQNS